MTDRTDAIAYLVEADMKRWEPPEGQDDIDWADAGLPDVEAEDPVDVSP